MPIIGLVHLSDLWWADSFVIRLSFFTDSLERKRLFCESSLVWSSSRSPRRAARCVAAPLLRCSAGDAFVRSLLIPSLCSFRSATCNIFRWRTLKFCSSRLNNPISLVLSLLLARRADLRGWIMSLLIFSVGVICGLFCLSLTLSFAGHFLSCVSRGLFPLL